MDAKVKISKPGGHASSMPVRVTVESKELTISAPLGDFLAALAAQVGNPTMLFTQAALQARLDAAAAAVLAGMKQAATRL